MIICPLDVDRLKQQYREARPFPFLALEGFVDPEFAARLAASYPSYEEALKLGRGFKAVNENKKVQITDYERFPAPAQQLSDALASEEFRRALSAVTGIPNLIWDQSYAGGGMHQTASHGHLDVHVDFNVLDELGLFRRLNLLLYLNDVWQEDWGGLIELWDQDVRVRHHAFAPLMNRCVIFETSERSFHGVSAVACPPDVQRKSFAVYYYTKEPPPGWDGKKHSTIFKARPEEYLKGYVLMPAEQLGRAVEGGVQSAKRTLKKLLGRDQV